MSRQPFTCHDCGDTFQPADDTCATGYAVLNDEEQPEHKVCYECALKRDLADAGVTGKLFAYVNSHLADRWNRRGWKTVRCETIDKVTTWPGLQLNVGPVHTVNTWRSNFGDVRTAFTCNIATGPNNGLELWHGLTYGDNGTYCRLRRAKNQPVEKLPRDGQPVFYDTRGRLTAYGLACGYVEKYTTQPSRFHPDLTETELYHEGNCYHIRTHKPSNFGIRTRYWDVADTLTKARQKFSRHVKEYHKAC